MQLAPGYKTEKNENITTSVEQDNLVIHGFIPKGVNTDPEVVLTLPSGNVAKYPLDKSAIDSDGFLKRGVVFEKTIPLKESGEYLVEMNYNTGFAAYNGPIIHGDFLPILPSSYDSATKGITGSLDAVRIQSLKFINTLRDTVGETPLSLDDTLNTLATIKANDMAEHNYLSHYDSQGEKITGTAKRNGISLSGNSIGENVAGGNVSSDILLI